MAVVPEKSSERLGVFNLSDPEGRQDLSRFFRGTAGVWEVKAVPWKHKRSGRANRYYFGCVIRYFMEFLHAQGEMLTAEECHELLKATLLRRTAFNQKTGEVIGDYVLSTKEMSSAEFTKYVEDARNWLAEMFLIVTPDPNQ